MHTLWIGLSIDPSRVWAGGGGVNPPPNAVNQIVKKREREKKNLALTQKHHCDHFLRLLTKGKQRQLGTVEAGRPAGLADLASSCGSHNCTVATSRPMHKSLHGSRWYTCCGLDPVQLFTSACSYIFGERGRVKAHSDVQKKFCFIEHKPTR